MAGLHKHKWSYTVKYAPDHFGSNKWHPPNQIKTERWINLNQLEALAGNGKELDLSALGFDKLLGKGNVSAALKVKVPRASSSAVEKIKAAGGSIEILEPSEAESAQKDGSKASEKPTQKK